ncbi:Phytochelatin synthase-domain-containing protein [Pyronema omphalodes]|nr:Phytochelatin synthase-domain-containing protein [Pyronema omphalodes]
MPLRPIRFSSAVSSAYRATPSVYSLPTRGSRASRTISTILHPPRTSSASPSLQRHASSAHPASTPYEMLNTPPPVPVPVEGKKVKESFYMRELPTDKLVGYESPEGKELFKAALMEGGLEAFFPLSQQFLTQNEPAFCGLGTLCMILNALKIDPAATWRKPWRWFTQEMLDCCRPLDWVKENGITLAEFTCLAKCNGLDATTRFADETSFAEFERAVRACTFSTGQLMAVSYSRASLGQTGSGHFSPVGGYTSKNGVSFILGTDQHIILGPVTTRHGFKSTPRFLYITSARDTCSSLSPRFERHQANLATPLYPLAKLCETASSYHELITALAAILRSPSGLPTVSSRYESSHHNILTSLSKSPSFDTTTCSEAHTEYRQGVASLRRYFRENSVLYKELELDELWKTEITVFILALLAVGDVRRRLGAAVREEVERRLQGDYEDERIAREVEGVRRQMESLVELGDVECRREGGCCGGKGTCG